MKIRVYGRFLFVLNSYKTVTKLVRDVYKRQDVDGQPHLERDDNGRTGGTAEINRQRAIIG